MTSVKIFYEGNVPVGFGMYGHAKYCLDGPDIVCASLSAASQMTINGLVEWLGVDCTDLITEKNEVWGTLAIKVPDEIGYNPAAHHLLRAFEIYIEALAEAYPKNVRYERRQLDVMH